MTKDEAQSRRGGTDGLFTKPSILFDHSSFTITWTDGQVKIAFSHQHSVPALVSGMLHTIARRDSILRK